MNVVVSRNESQKIYQRIECDTSLWIKQAIIQLIVLILFRQSGVLSVCISRAILITQEVSELPYTIIMHTSTVTLLLGLGGGGMSTDYQLTTLLWSQMSGLINIKVRLLRERAGEQWGVNYATPSCVILQAVTKKLTHRLRNSQLHVCDERKMSDKGVWNSLKVHKGLSSSL